MHGYIGSYVHEEGQMAAMVELRIRGHESPPPEAIQLLAREIAMQVTAMQPSTVDATGIEQEWGREMQFMSARLQSLDPSERERKIASERAKFERHFCLLEQPYIRESGSVRQHIEKTEALYGVTVEVVRFIRYAVGPAA